MTADGDTPIACSLTAAELPARLAAMAAIGREALDEVEATAGGRAVLRFRPGVRARLEEVVAAESECCAFLDMRLQEEPGAVVLTIAGPAAAAPVVEDLVAAFRGGVFA